MFYKYTGCLSPQSQCRVYVCFHCQRDIGDPLDVGQLGFVTLSAAGVNHLFDNPEREPKSVVPKWHHDNSGIPNAFPFFISRQVYQDLLKETKSILFSGFHFLATT